MYTEKAAICAGDLSQPWLVFLLRVHLFSQPLG